MIIISYCAVKFHFSRQLMFDHILQYIYLYIYTLILLKKELNSTITSLHDIFTVEFDAIYTHLRIKL